MSLTGPCSTADGRSPTVPPAATLPGSERGFALCMTRDQGTRFSLLLKPCCHSSGFSFPRKAKSSEVPSDPKTHQAPPAQHKGTRDTWDTLRHPTGGTSTTQGGGTEHTASGTPQSIP